MMIRDERPAPDKTKPTTTQIYSIHRPDIALAMSSCWISLVPSKIVWLFESATMRHSHATGGSTAGVRVRVTITPDSLTYCAVPSSRIVNMP
jgi:hypothetical protein